MKKMMSLSTLALTIIMLVGCAHPTSTVSEANILNNCTLSIADMVQPLSAEPAKKIENPFTLKRSGDYFLYAYNSGSLGYTSLGAYVSGEMKSNYPTEFEAVINAVNGLSVLEKTSKMPSGNAKYGLMTVANDGKYTKVQYYLYKDMLTVNGTPYKISEWQYNTLKTAMESGTKVQNAVPQWFVYMNPNRVTGITGTDTNGKIQKMPKGNVLNAAKRLTSIFVKSAKTYKLGSKDFTYIPFRAIYTFDSGVTYTVWVSKAGSRSKDVTIYVESSDMSYGCEYIVSGYIDDYIEATQAMLSGDVNPGMGNA